MASCVPWNQQPLPVRWPIAMRNCSGPADHSPDLQESSAAVTSDCLAETKLGAPFVFYVPVSNHCVAVHTLCYAQEIKLCVSFMLFQISAISTEFCVRFICLRWGDFCRQYVYLSAVSFRFRYAKSWIDSRLMSSVVFYTQITLWGYVSLLRGLAINIIFLQIIGLYILYLKRVTSCVIVHAQTNKCTIAKLFSYTVLFITPTCFGHSCDHIQGVPQHK